MRPSRRPTLSDQGLRGFRETVAEAEGLGGAAAAANRSAHEVYEAMPDDRPPSAAGDNEVHAAEHYFEPQPAAEPLRSHEPEQTDEYAPPPEAQRSRRRRGRSSPPR